MREGKKVRKNELDEAYLLYERPLFLYALSLTHVKEDAEDLVSETFIKAFLSYDDYNGNLENWLLKVLKNLFIDKYRKKIKNIDESKYSIEWIKDQYDAMEFYIKEERKRWLYMKLYSFPQRERDVMLLTLTLALSDEEIADYLNLSVNNVRTIRYRVKKKLSDLVKKEGL